MGGKERAVYTFCGTEGRWTGIGWIALVIAINGWMGSERLSRAPGLSAPYVEVRDTLIAATRASVERLGACVHACKIWTRAKYNPSSAPLSSSFRTHVRDCLGSRERLSSYRGGGKSGPCLRIMGQCRWGLVAIVFTAFRMRFN